MPAGHYTQEIEGLLQAYMDRSVETESGCIIIPGTRYLYPRIDTSRGGRKQFYHVGRLLLERSLGRDLAPGEMMRHMCHNPACVNIDHLKAGSAYDNTQDRILAGRGCKGESRPLHKLTENDVRDIRRRFTGRRGENAALAREYGVSATAMSWVVRGLTWKHVK